MRVYAFIFVASEVRVQSVLADAHHDCRYIKALPEKALYVCVCISTGPGTSVCLRGRVRRADL